MQNEKRKIIIVWWWKKGTLATDVDYWNVGSLGDQLIRIDERNSTQAQQFIAAEVLKHISDSQVLLLLHRNHGYQDQAISAIVQQVSRGALAHAKNFRAFLFGEGEDAVYLSANPRGLLGSKGSWIALQGGKTTSAVQDEEKQQIKKIHFNDVWQRYQGELKEQVFSLKEELFTTFLPLMSHPEADAYPFLRQKENEVLLLRILSFIGRVRNGSRQEQQLKKAQEAAGEKWLFGDIKNNLIALYGDDVAKQYQSLVRTIKSTLLTSSTNIDWVNLRDGFDRLLLILT